MDMKNLKEKPKEQSVLFGSQVTLQKEDPRKKWILCGQLPMRVSVTVICTVGVGKEHTSAMNHTNTHNNQYKTI